MVRENKTPSLNGLSFWGNRIRDVARAEKALAKAELRKAIAEKRYGYVYRYCICAHPRHRRTMVDIFAFGAGMCLVDDAYVLWVLRYFYRLTGERMPKNGR